MMKFIPCWVLAFAAFASPLVAQQQPPAPAIRLKPEQIRPFVPEAFDPSKLVETARFKMVPLGPAMVDRDYRAYMSSIEHLQKTFSRSTTWPHEGISRADAVKDMENEQARFTKRQSFDYAVLTVDGSRELGSVYISPSHVAGYDAVVRMWVTKDAYDAGLDAELYAWLTNWMQTAWPFKKVAYPGRAIDWQTWDNLRATN